MRLKKKAFLIGVCVVATTTANADFVNGGFETGNLSGWALSGYGSTFWSGAAVQTWTAWNPAEEDYFALLTVMHRSGQSPVHYAMVSQDFTASLGDVITFSAFAAIDSFLTEARAEVSYDNGTTWSTIWSRTTGNSSPGGEWDNVSVAIPQTTPFGKLRVWLDNRNPTTITQTSQAGFDNFAIVTVPAPAASLLGVIGLVATAYFRRRAL